MTLQDRLMDQVSPEPMSGCWLWLGAPDKDGYGRIRTGNRERHLSHRVSFEIFKGPIPDGLQVDHLCRTPSCVNPKHLEAVTPSVNFLRTGACETNRKRMAAITHCPQGHEYTTENTILEGPEKTKRKCLACRRDYDRRRGSVRTSAR